MMRSTVSVFAPVLVLFLCAEWVLSQEAEGSGERILSEAMEQLVSADAGERSIAALIIGRMGPKAAKAIPKLVHALGDGNEDVRLSAALALGKMGAAGASAVGVLESRGAACSGYERGFIFEALASLARDVPEARKVLLGHVQGKDKDLVMAALRGLGEAGPRAEDVARVVANAVFDSHKGVSVCAIGALAKMGESAASVVPLMLAEASGGEEKRESASTWALAELANGSPSALTALAGLLAHDREQVRWNAAGAFCLHVQPMGEVAPALIRALAAEDGHALKDIFRALTKFGPAARDALPGLCGDLDGPNSREAAWGLAALGVSDSEVVAALNRAAGSGSPSCVSGIKFALWVLTGEEAGVQESLLVAIKNENPDPLCLYGLTRMGPLADDALKTLSKREDDFLSFWADTAMWDVRAESVQSIPGLLDRLSRAGPEARFQAIEALGGMGRSAEPAVPGLLKALRLTRDASVLLKHRGVLDPAEGAGGDREVMNALLLTEERVAIIRALMAMGPDALYSARGELRAVRDCVSESDWVREAARVSIQNLQGEY